jgi:predicted Zn-dependent protease
MLGQYDAATESARRMQAASPNFPLATPLLAASLVRSGHKPEAEKLLRDYLAANPNVDASSVAARMRSNDPHFVEAAIAGASLRDIGLRYLRQAPRSTSKSPPGDAGAHLPGRSGSLRRAVTVSAVGSYR